MVAAVSVTLAAWVRACCFTPSILALIWWTALTVSVILEASSEPILVISVLFSPTVFIEEPILEMVWLKYSDKSVTSSLPCTGRRTVRSPSPWAMSLRASTTILIGFIIIRATKKTMIKLTAKTPNPMRIISIRSSLTVPINSLTGAFITIVQSVVFIVA